MLKLAKHEFDSFCRSCKKGIKNAAVCASTIMSSNTKSKDTSISKGEPRDQLKHTEDRKHSESADQLQYHNPDMMIAHEYFLFQKQFNKLKSLVLISVHYL